MSIFDARDRFAIEMKLPLSARFRHSLAEIAWAENTVREQRPHYSSDEVKGLALARLDALKHIQAQ